MKGCNLAYLTQTACSPRSPSASLLLGFDVADEEHNKLLLPVLSPSLGFWGLAIIRVPPGEDNIPQHSS